MLDRLVDGVAGGWTGYPIIFLIVLGDAVVPVLPGETAIITGGILAADGALSPVLVLAAGALGAFAGDNIAYWLGRSASRRFVDRLFRTERSQARLEWARRQIDARGATIVATARFVPGGRTAATFTAGTVELPWARFAAADLVGSLLWAGLATAMGYLGGSAFEGSLWKPLLIGLGAGALVALAGEAWHRRRSAAGER